MSTSPFPSDSHPAAIDDWLAALPMHNARESCRIMYAGLQALNANPPRIAAYWLALERLRPVVKILSRNLAPVFMNKPFPLEEKTRKVAKLSAQFHAELGEGYQRIAADSGFAAMFETEEKVRVLNRALRSFETFYLRLALIHELPGTRLWENVNALYRQAESLAVSAGGTDGGIHHDIIAVYARMQVARLIAPCRLRQSDCARVAELLKLSGGLIGLHASLDEDDRADYWVDLASSKPPQARAFTPPRGSELRYLTVRPLLNHIAAFGQGSASIEEYIEEPLATYLQVRLGALPAIAFDQKSRDATLIEGFAALHDAVEGLKPGLGGWNNGLEGLEIVPLSDHDGYSAAREGSKSAGTFVSAGARRPGQGSMVEAAHGGAHMYCRVQRSDTPGYYVVEPTRGMVQRYGLAGLKTDNKLIQVGLIHPNTRPGLGAAGLPFELLQRESEAVHIRCDGAHLEVRKALAGRSAGEDALTLITLPLRLKNGEGLVVERPGKQERYRVAKVLEANDEFVQFEVVPETA